MANHIDFEEGEFLIGKWVPVGVIKPELEETTELKQESSRK
jgi:hypothetical protein